MNLQIPYSVKQLGHKIIAYIFNVPNEDAERIINDNYQLTDEQVAVLNEYVNLCKQLLDEKKKPSESEFKLFINLPNFVKDDKHIFQIWHEHFGGTIIKIEHDDPVVSILNNIFSKLFPLFLINLSDDNTFYGHPHLFMSISINKLPEIEMLYEEIIKDSSISEMFDFSDKNVFEMSENITSSSGWGGGVSLAQFASTMFNSSFELMRLRNSVSHEAFSEAAFTTITMIRNLAKGNIIDSPIFVGFDNINIGECDSIDTQWGVIRQQHDGLVSLMRHYYLHDKRNRSGNTVVLEAKYPLAIKKGLPSKSNPWPKEMDICINKVSELEENVSLCFALACNGDFPVGVSYSWQLKYDPFCHSSQFSWKNKRSRFPFSVHTIKENEIENISTWSKAIANVNSSNIRVAIRRLLSALNERQNPADGFIDTIIAWENLFGARTEISNSISIAMAKLLETDIEERLKVVQRIKKLYNCRSAIVHGGGLKKGENVERYRNECIVLTLKVLKVLYGKKPELITNKDRAKLIALE